MIKSITSNVSSGEITELHYTPEELVLVVAAQQAAEAASDAAAITAAAVAYKAQRAAEYPPMTDYLDGIVKGDAAQVQAYIDTCLAVKLKYPKP